MPKFLNEIQYYDKKGNLKTVSNTFDLVISTQAEFDAMIGSVDWFDAKSVALVGNGGTLAFTRSDGLGIKIPQRVRQIQGFNFAKIEVTEFVYQGATNRAALWYETSPTTDDYSIKDLSVSCTGSSSVAGDVYAFMNCTRLINCISTTNVVFAGVTRSAGYGFYNCTKLTNCTGNGTGGSTSNNSGIGYGFHSCTQLINCTGTGTGRGIGYGFYNCTKLTNCTGNGSGTGGVAGAGSGNSFYSCTQLTNCTGTGTGTGNNSGSGFSTCVQLTNCTGSGIGGGTSTGSGFYSCTQLTNCTGTGTSTGSGSGISFNNCSYCNGCKINNLPKTAIWGGTTTKRDDSSCQLE